MNLLDIYQGVKGCSIAKGIGQTFILYIIWKSAKHDDIIAIIELQSVVDRVTGSGSFFQKEPKKSKS